MSAGKAIEARGLVKRFGDFKAVDGIDLAVEEGERFGLLGPNGAGKTTLVRMLTAVLPVTEGEAFVAGIDVRRDPKATRQAIGVVPQALTSDLDLTGWENLDIFARFFSVPKAVRRPRMEELLRKVGLWERRDELVKAYSGGMRRRLEIARGLIHRPKVLFLDEPTIGLDPQSRLVIWDLLRDLRQGGGLTVSLTTHYLDEAEALCDRVAIIDGGKIVALGTPRELMGKIKGGDSLELVLGAAPSGELVEKVHALPGVVVAEASPTGLRIRADAGETLLPRLVIALEHEGVTVTSARLAHVTLDEVFIQVTGRSLRDAGGGGPPRSPLTQRFT